MAPTSAVCPKGGQVRDWATGLYGIEIHLGKWWVGEGEREGGGERSMSYDFYC
jgi:hypothetical protein